MFTLPFSSRIFAGFACGLPLLFSATGAANAQSPAQSHAAPRRVAVFDQPGFPVYGMLTTIEGRHIIAQLKAAGVEADALQTADLARPDRFNAKKYVAVVFPYGNTYPAEAFANLQAFHRAGGSLVTTGIPFTHAAASVDAKGWKATPQWGQSVRRAIGEGKSANTNALRIAHGTGDWAGVDSPRFGIKPGDTVRAIIVARDNTPAKNAARSAGRPPRAAAPADADALYIRFFDGAGEYLSQVAAPFAAPPVSVWKTAAVRAVAPPNAAFADLSVQVKSPSRSVRVADFSAKVNSKTVVLANANFTQTGSDFSDLGHSDLPALWGKDGIGVGGFAGPDPTSGVSFTPVSGDPLGISRLSSVANAGALQTSPQWLDPKSLPSGARIEPLVGDEKHPLVALVIHENDQFKGAVDAWTYHLPKGGDREAYDAEQLLSRATIAVLARKGALSTSLSDAIAAVEAVPGPKVYANLVLPTPPRTYSTFQPKMPAPARHLYVADVRGLSTDERILMQSLQGIVNRKQPRIYFIYNDGDRFWLNELQKQKQTDAPIKADPWDLVKKFQGETKGVVLCDPKVYESICTAVSLAGADDLLVAKTPEISARIGLPIKMDLRGKFKNNADAIHYLRTEIMPRLDPYLTCSLDPAVYGAGGLDSVIAAKGSFFWITGPKTQNTPGANSDDELSELSEMFADMPLGAVVRGFWWHGDGVGMQESDGVTLGSRFGKVTLVSDLIANLSVQSGVPAEKLMQKPRKPAPPLDKNKVYLCFTMSDGDNLCTWHDYFRKYFNDPVRGQFPVGWGMAPALRDLAPSWARWYYEQATENDEFFCDVSGVAYMYPSSWGTTLQNRDGAFDFFYGKTAQYMNNMDMKTLRLMDVRASDIARVGPLLPGVEFLLPDYGHDGAEKYSDLTYSLPDGQAIFRAATNGDGPENLAGQIRRRAGTSRPAFINAFIWNWGSSLSDLKKTLELLGPNYVAVTPSQLNTLYRQAHAQNTKTANAATAPAVPRLAK